MAGKNTEAVLIRLRQSRAKRRLTATCLMPVWPKSFYTFGLSLKTAATEWKLRQKTAAPRAQARALAALTPRLAATSFWRAAGIEAGMPYARFQSRVPLQTYEQLAPAIARMQQGEADVLWPGRCALFARSAATSTGEPKLLPVTEEMLAHFRRAGADALLYYTVRVRHAGVFRSRHLILGGSTALTPIAGAAGHEAYAGDLSGIVAVNQPAWAERHLYEPGATAAKFTDWDEMLAAIVARIRGRDISLLAGIPSSLLQLTTALREPDPASGTTATQLQTRWPNLECVIHTGVPLGPFGAELRAALGPAPKFHEVYAASEGFIASQDTDAPAAGLRLMADLGVFFEFLPMAEFDRAHLDQLGRKAVPLPDVKPNTDYALVLTTPGGLARYVVEDVVRFVSTEPARLIYVGRTTLRLNSFGEQVMEKELTDALVAVCTRQKWSLVNFHVAPLPPGMTTAGQVRGRHEWWIELKPGTISTPIGPQIAAELEIELTRANPTYAARRRGGVLDGPVVRLVMPGVFEHWLRYQGRWGGQHKLPRCRSDRLIADELAQITNFARD